MTLFSKTPHLAKQQEKNKYSSDNSSNTSLTKICAVIVIWLHISLTHYNIAAICNAFELSICVLILHRCRHSSTCILLALWTWASHGTTLGLSFHISRMKIKFGSPHLSNCIKRNMEQYLLQVYVHCKCYPVFSGDGSKRIMSFHSIYLWDYLHF